MKKLNLGIMAFAAVSMLMSCATHGNKGTPDSQGGGKVVSTPLTPSKGGFADSAPVRALPRAVIYKMNGDYADNVPVNVNAAGEIVSYPAPTDLGPNSTPIKLDDGYWLDRRGISSMTRFTRYTYSEYRTLKQTPTTSQLLDAIIPGAAVTEIVCLPVNACDIEGSPEEVNDYISRGLQGCDVIFRAPVAPPAK